MKGLSIFCACVWSFHTITQIAYLAGAVETGITPITGLCACILTVLFFIEQAMKY